MITLKQIAKIAGVSVMCVSKSLHDARDISSQTKSRIKKLAASLGYMPNQNARNFRSQATRTIGVVIPNITYSFFSEIIHGLELVLNSRGYHLVLTHSGSDPERELSQVKNLLSQRVEGLIVAHTIDTPALQEIYLRLQNLQFPVIFVDRLPNPRIKFPTVISNDREGARKIATHLLNLGHKKIVYLSGPRKISTADIRKECVLSTLRRRGIKPIKVIEGDFEFESGYRAAETIAKMRKRPTAVIAVNDPSAIGLIHGLIEKGIQVPGDISVVGYAGISFGEYCRVPLTTVIQPSVKMGEVAAQLLIERLQGKKVLSQILPIQLCIRGSTRLVV